MKTCINLTIALLMLMFVSALYGQEEETDSEPARYVDLDGDGIDDNARDLDEDGIPDSFGAEVDEEEAPELSLGAQMGLDLDQAATVSESAAEAAAGSNRDIYSSRSFCARDLANDRGGFGEPEEPGAQRGKTCINGVCF